MIERLAFTNYLNSLLLPSDIPDYCPNGLQIQGKNEIQRIVTGVTACQALLDAAVEQQADAILVHHGYFWKGEPEVLSGSKCQRIKTLLTHDINLYAYHLPLDVHPEYGNNVQLAKLLEINVLGIQDINGLPCLYFGEFSKPLNGVQCKQWITKQLNREPLHIEAEREINTLAWCTGAAQDFIEHAINLNVDAYLTGEISERTVHQAREANIHCFAAGHHATERYGIQALGQHCQQHLSLDHQFIDIPNPV